MDEMARHKPDEIIAAARTKIFDFSYPIYEAGHKPELETKILKHYYTREIGAETVGLWKLWLNDTLNMVMPKYNKLYKAEAATFEKMLFNLDVTTHSMREDDFEKRDDHTRTDNLTDATDMTTTNNLTHTTIDRYSDTPQGTVTNVDNNTYLTDYRHITDTDTGTQNNAGTVDHTGTSRNMGSENNEGTQEITASETGYRGSKTYAELMAEYADKVLNIDMMIVNELSDLFMKLW